MTAVPRNDDARATARSRAKPAVVVLAERLAAAMVHHEPGRRLPRLTMLARRYNVSTSVISLAIDELAAAHLVRRLPDGQVYRASPAEYWVPLEGIIGLVPRLDPVGGQLLCVSSHAEMRRPPEHIGRALGVASTDPVLGIRCLWTVGGEPAAVASSYVSEKVAAKLGALPVVKPGDEDAAQNCREQAGAGLPLAFPVPRQPGQTPSPWPAALQIEMSLPPPSTARTLRVAAGQPVVTVTLSFPGLTSTTADALTIVMLRPELSGSWWNPRLTSVQPFIDGFVGD